MLLYVVIQDYQHIKGDLKLNCLKQEKGTQTSTVKKVETNRKQGRSDHNNEQGCKTTRRWSWATWNREEGKQRWQIGPLPQVGSDSFTSFRKAFKKDFSTFCSLISKKIQPNLIPKMAQHAIWTWQLAMNNFIKSWWHILRLPSVGFGWFSPLAGEFSSSLGWRPVRGSPTTGCEPSSPSTSSTCSR